MNSGLVQVKCSFDNQIIPIQKILEILPQWRTVITQIEVVGEAEPHLQIKFLLSANTAEEITHWLKAFEEKTKTTYSVKSTEKCTGRYVLFKQRRYCQHNTKCERVYNPSIRGNTRNTNCPSRMTITLRAVKSRHRHKNNPPDPEFPCEIDLIPTHNHNIGTPNELKFRPVAEDVKTTLKKLYEIGHSAATAREMIKISLQLKYEDYEQMLADRKYYPDYQYCYYQYKVFKEENESVDFDKRKEFITKIINDINRKDAENSAQITFEDNDYVICICPPLMRRIHENTESSANMVLLDSCGTLNSSQIFILLTNSECGSLPLAVIITSCDSTNLLTRGLQSLQHTMKDSIFYGSVEGPKMFLTNDLYSEKIALKNVWPKSAIYICAFDVLQEVWKWLTKTKNNIPQEMQHSLFQDFKTVLYAKSPKECSQKYCRVKDNAKSYPHYCRFLDEYWDRKKLWAFCYRSNMIEYPETAMKFLKEKIFHSVKNFNVVQLLHFILTNFTEYYRTRLLDAAQNQIHKNVLSRPFSTPSEASIQKMQPVVDNIVTIPSDNEENMYTVNLDVLMCTCFNGNTLRFCKHLDWICCLLFAHKFIITLSNMDMCPTYYKMATGTDVPLECLLTIRSDDDNYLLITNLDSQENYIISNTDTNFLNYNIEETDTDMIAKGKKTVEELGKALEQYLETSPREVLPALEAMKEKICSLNSISSFTSSCYNFGNDFLQNDISLQVNPVSSQKKAAPNDRVAQKPRTLILKVGKKSYLLPKRKIERLESR